MKYSIVIPTFNHCDDLLRPCVDNLLKYSDLSNLELIVVANGCTDNTKYYLDTLTNLASRIGYKEHIRYIWSDEPLGFAKATNQGIKASTGSRVVLLNNDAHLIEQGKDWWLRLLEQPFLDDPNCGISGSIKIHSDITDRSFVIFFCAMIDRKVFDKIGLLNEEYGVGGCEDIEFCWLAEEAGFTTIQCVEKQWSQELNLHTSIFPIYHRGEGTMHDSKLVPGWSDIFLANKMKLQQKYQQYKDSLSL